jgi:hypothetical protein
MLMGQISARGQRHPAVVLLMIGQCDCSLTRGIRRGERLEHAPRDTHDELGTHEHRHALRENRQKDRADHEDHAPKEGPLGAVPLLAETSDHEPDELPAGRNVTQGALRRGRDDELAVLHDAEPGEELGQPKERVDLGVAASVGVGSTQQNAE